MNPFSDEHIEILKNKFFTYAESFFSDNKDIHDHILLKRDHTIRVCNEMENLTMQMGLSQQEKTLACIIALFHDLGRFAQYFKYQTFDDNKSVNHAELSVKTLQSDGFLETIPPENHEIIFKTIQNHNLPYLEMAESDEIIFYSKLLRDADKLDIWYVITNEELRKVIEQKEEEKIYQVPDSIYQQFLNREFVSLNLVSNDNDMRLLRISWIFDINFKETVKEIKRRNLIQKIVDLIPESERKKEIETIVFGYIEEKIGA